jgi:PTH1 family peptidyl-tRNA hydrolase
MGFEIHLLKPQTFMNESGRAYAQWKVKNQGDHRILVVYDDLDLPVGRLRLRYKGSDGGQRGMRSVIEHFGSNDVPRLRIGIGRNGEEASDYVLSRFTPDQWTHITPLVQDAQKHLEIFLNHESEKAMNLVNSLQYGEK